MPALGNDTGPAAPPAVHLTDIGAELVGALYNIDEPPMYDYATSKPVLWDDGSQRTETRLWLIVVASKGAVEVGKKDERRPPEPGDRVTVYVSGSAWYEWKEAIKGHGTTNTGDLVKYWYDRDEPASKAGFHPKKVRTFAIRAPKPDEAALKAECDAEYELVKDNPAPAPAAEASSEPAWNEEPF